MARALGMGHGNTGLREGMEQRHSCPGMQGLSAQCPALLAPPGLLQRLLIAEEARHVWRCRASRGPAS